MENHKADVDMMVVDNATEASSWQNPYVRYQISTAPGSNCPTMAELIGLKVGETNDGMSRIHFHPGVMRAPGSYDGQECPSTEIVLTKLDRDSDKTGQNRLKGIMIPRVSFQCGGNSCAPVKSISMKADDDLAQYLTQPREGLPWPTALYNVNNRIWSIPECLRCGAASLGELSMDCGNCLGASIDVSGTADFQFRDGSCGSGRITLSGAPEVVVDSIMENPDFADCFGAMRV